MLDGFAANRPPAVKRAEQAAMAAGIVRRTRRCGSGQQDLAQLAHRPTISVKVAVCN